MDASASLVAADNMLGPSVTPSAALYRVSQQVSTWGWVDLEFGYSTVFRILLEELGRMGKAGGYDEWNTHIKVDPTQVRDLLAHPVVCSKYQCIIIYRNVP